MILQKADDITYRDIITMQLRIQPHQHKADREPLSASILPTISHQKYCGDSPMPAKPRIQQASAKLRNVFVKALLWC